MKNVFIPREISELESGSVILLSDKLYTVKRLKFISGFDVEPDRYEFLAVPGNMSTGDENKLGKRITVPAGYVFTTQQEQLFSFLQVSCLASFGGGLLIAFCIWFLNLLINT